MMRARGFSLLEIMLALIVVGIGISIVLTFSSNDRQQTHGQANGNDYSVVTNDILQQLVSDIQTCNTNIPSGNCPVQTQFAETNTISAYDYLCGNSNNSSSVGTCKNDKISVMQYQSLKTAGIDLLTTTVTLSASQSDSPDP